MMTMKTMMPKRCCSLVLLLLHRLLEEDEKGMGEEAEVAEAVEGVAKLPAMALLLMERQLGEDEVVQEKR